MIPKKTEIERAIGAAAVGNDNVNTRVEVPHPSYLLAHLVALIYNKDSYAVTARPDIDDVCSVSGNLPQILGTARRIALRH